MPQNNQTLLEKTVADQWQTLPSGLTVLVRPMPGYSSTHVIYATKFGSIDREFCLNGQTVHLPAGVAHFLEHKMFEDEDGDAFAKYAKTGANANAYTSFARPCYLFPATQQLDESLGRNDYQFIYSNPIFGMINDCFQRTFAAKGKKASLRLVSPSR